MGTNYGTLGGQFKQGGQEFGDVLGGAVGAVSGTVDAIVSGNTKYTRLTSDFNDLKTIFEGTNNSFNDKINPPTAAQLTARHVAAQVKTNTAYSAKRATESMGIGSVANNAYSGAKSSVIPPSQIAKISHPGVKTAIASTNGGRRQALKNDGQALDIASAGSPAPMSGSINSTSGLADTGTGTNIANGSSPAVPMGSA